MNVSGILSLLNELVEKIDRDPSTAKIILQKVIDTMGWSEDFLALDKENIGKVGIPIQLQCKLDIDN